MSHVRRTLFGAILICILMADFKVHSQDPVETTLTMIVRTRPELPESEILSTLNRGLDNSRCKIDGKPVIRLVPPTAYEVLEGLLNPTAAPLPAELDTPLTPRLVPARETLWEFRLNEPTQIMKKLTVRYKKAGTKHYEPKDLRTDPKAFLTLTALGRYALHPESGDVPLEYEVTTMSLGKKDEVFKQNWPKSQRFFVITLRNFRGDRIRFFKTIQDGEQVPNPLTLLDTAREHSFVFANLGIDTPKAGITLTGNVLLTEVAGLRDRKVRRVWMLFPLTEDQYIHARDEYRKFDPEQLSQEIRKKKIPLTDEAEVSAVSAPQWIELGEVGTRQIFARKITLQVDEKLKTRFPNVWRLLVWEFDDGVGPPTAIGVQHDKDGRVFVLEEELREWAPVVLRKALK